MCQNEFPFEKQQHQIRLPKENDGGNSIASFITRCFNGNAVASSRYRASIEASIHVRDDPGSLEVFGRTKMLIKKKGSDHPDQEAS